jgi:protein involved in polysaccharide export with SLBB domain
MNSQPSKFVGTLMLVGLLIGLLQASAADKNSTQNKGKSEYQEAEHAASKKQASVEIFQREIDKLEDQKATAQREIAKCQANLEKANEQLKHFTDLKDEAEMARWQKDATAWDDQRKKAQTLLANIEANTQAAIQNFQKSLKENYESFILPGESLEVFVTEDDSLNGPYQVRRGGYIIMPRVGRVYLAGKDLAGAEKAIKAALQVNQLKNSTVMVERAQAAITAESGPAVYLAGEFLRPGPWRIPQGVMPTAVTTVLRSGGLTSAADLSKVKLLRLVNGQGLVEAVDVQAILSGADLSSDLNLNPGDIVMVPAFANVIYVTGTVSKPGPMKLLPDDELTTYSAILRSGGFARFANRKKVYVLRDMGDGPKKKISVNIKDIQDGKSPDVILKSKDIVVVPEKFFSW